AIFLSEKKLGIVGGIRHGPRKLVVQLDRPFHLGSATRRQRLVPRDGQQPGRNRRAPFERTRLAPDVQEHVAQEVLGQALIAHKANEPAIDRDPMPGKQHAHGTLIGIGDTSDQHVIRESLGRRCPSWRSGGPPRARAGRHHCDPLSSRAAQQTRAAEGFGPWPMIWLWCYPRADSRYGKPKCLRAAKRGAWTRRTLCSPAC